jgi:predicted nucleic acid-binding protein
MSVAGKGPLMALPARLFCDTSFFYACFDQHDVNHEQAKQLSQEAAIIGYALYVTWDIISETLVLLRYRRTYRALTFLTEVKPHLRIVNYGETVRTKAEQFFRRYGRDRKLSFCDSISFVVVTTLLNAMPSLAFDTDFRALGLTVIP